MSLVIEKNVRIFQDNKFMKRGFGGAIRAWKVLDFILLRVFNIVIVVCNAIW